MNIKLNLIVVVLILFVHDVEPMVHGKLASKNQFPHQVSLRNTYNQHICGGTIIHKKFILTAAHCVYKRHLKDIHIVAGTIKLSTPRKIFKPKHIFRGNYNTTVFSNDIALIKLHQDILFTKSIQPLQLNVKHIPANSTMTVCGWGLKNSYGSFYPNDLHYSKVTSLSLHSCRKMFNDIPNIVITEKDICTFIPGKGVCSGDSGGPLIYNGKLAGIISHGIPCADGYPDVYTNVASYYHHIVNIIKHF